MMTEVDIRHIAAEALMSMCTVRLVYGLDGEQARKPTKSSVERVRRAATALGLPLPPPTQAGGA